MTSHGFGAGKLQSGRVNSTQKAEFARRVSKEVKHIIRAHAVKTKTGSHDIIFEFEHLKDHGKKPEDLWKEIQKISVDGHKMAPPDFYIIESSYQRGNKLPEH